MSGLEIYIDGASKGNPGHSGIGVVICRQGETIKNVCRYIGQATNNVAEYTALIDALQEALILRAQSLVINSDSQLLCRQLSRQYKVKNKNIASLYAQVMRLLSAFRDVKINNIPREENKGADRLANLAVKEALKKHK